ncbi:MAG: hypothetical protein PF636_03145 [Actinomycetota bacterium]|jgi:uncharacterized membrane protein|nr:hypothetical protein [Actinomycetota bacterium]
MDQTPGAPVEVIDRPAPASESSKIFAVLGYIFGIPAVVALLMEPYKNEKFVRFHAWQAIGLWVAAALVGWFPIIGQLVGLAVFVYAVYLAVKAWAGEYVEIPVVYGMLKGQIGD